MKLEELVSDPLAQARLEALVLFLKTQSKGGIETWYEGSIRAYVLIKMGQDAFRFGILKDTNEIVAVAVYWRMREEELRRPEFLDGPWRTIPDPAGDCLYIDCLVAARGFTPQMIAEFQWRNPDWRKLKCFAVRSGKLVQYNIERLLAKMETT